MPKNITVKFYRISGEGGGTFENILSNVYNKETIEREINIGDNDVDKYLVRLENLDTSEKPYFSGEFVKRVLVGNPPEATENGLSKLALKKGSGLGHQVAFAYHPALKALAIESSPHTLGLGRILTYMNMAAGMGSLRAVPIPNANAWKRYKKGAPRKLVFSVAKPNFANVEGDVSSVLGPTHKLQEIFDGPVITIEVSMGHRPGSLNQKIVTDVLNFFTNGAGKDQDIRSLKAISKPEEGQSEYIDFLNELLVEQDTLDQIDDPAKNYAVTRNFVLSMLKRHETYIKNYYGG